MGSGSGFEGVAKQLFGDTAPPAMEKVAAQGQNMHVNRVGLPRQTEIQRWTFSDSKMAAGDTTMGSTQISNFNICQNNNFLTKKNALWMPKCGTLTGPSVSLQR